MTTEPTLEFLHPKGWKPAIGYSNGVAARGRMIFTGGMIGWTLSARRRRRCATSSPCWPKPARGPSISCG